MTAVGPLSKGEAAAIVSDLVEIDSSASWEPWTEEQILSELPLKWDLSLVARSSGAVIGFLLASRKDAGAHIHRLVVSREHRGERVGRALLQGLNEQLVIRNDVRPIVTLKVARENEGAKRFYKNNGFRSRVHTGDSSHESLWRLAAGSRLRYGVHQPNYLPWQGYFSKLIACDVFVILDDVQMPQGRSYVSRTRIRKGEEEQWLTVPVSKALAPINQIKLVDQTWHQKHSALLADRYRKWPYFRPVMDMLQTVYAKSYNHLWEMNLELITSICSYMGVDRVFELSSPMQIAEMSDERIIRIGEKLGASSYLSGMGGMNYQSAQKFIDGGKKLEILTVKPIREERFAAEVPRIGYSIVETLFALAPERVSEALQESTEIRDETTP